MPYLYPGLYNSSYVPKPLEIKFAENPGGYLNPYILAVVLTFLVAGAVVSQAASYFRSKLFRNDTLFLRLHVALVLVLTLLKLIQVGAVGVQTFAVHFGDYLYLTHKDWLFRISVLLATIVSATVQVYFIKRVSSFSHHSPLFLVPTLAAWLGSIAGAIWVTIVFPEDWAKRSRSFVLAGRVAPGFTLACDLLVTGFALYFLWQKRMSFPDESPLFRIMRVLLESAAPPCLTATLNLVYDNQSAGGYVFLFVALTPMLQTLSMLYSLKSRVYFRERQSTVRTIKTISNGTPVSARTNFSPAYSHGVYSPSNPDATISSATASPSPTPYTPAIPHVPELRSGYNRIPQLELEQDLSDGSPFTSPQSAATPSSTRPLLLASPSSSPSASPRTPAFRPPPRGTVRPLRIQLADMQRPGRGLGVPWNPADDDRSTPVMGQAF